MPIPRLRIIFMFIITIIGFTIIDIDRGPLVNQPQAQSDSIKLSLQRLVGGLEAPVYITSARDGSNRLFIIEQPGRIRIFQGNELLPTPFLSIERLVAFGGERGLLGLAFHPNFKTNGRFFVDYTRDGDGATVIAEYKVSANNANLADATGRTLLIIPQPFSNHNGGQIDFGPDGLLYIGMGDGGAGGDPLGNGQNNDSLLGKILRINVDGQQPYQVPRDNPFVNAPGGDEIYATGFRNPYRFSFDRKTGELYVGDVGQNRLEEIDLVVKGGNYGWNRMEGSLCFNPSSNCNTNGLMLPITEYDRGFGCSVTGGYVYRGKLYPKLTGTYLYGDFCTGIIFGYRDGQSSVLMESNTNISSFGEDEDGELFVIDYNGTIFRLKEETVAGCSLGCPGNITVTDKDGDGIEMVDFSQPTTTGNCNNVSCLPTNQPFPLGTTTITCATGNNSASCTFTVTVEPVACSFNCPADVIVSDNDNDGGELVNFTLPVATGNCGTITTSIPSGSRFPVGTTLVTVTGLTIKCSFNVIVKPPVDTTAPTVRVLTPNGGEKVRAGTTLTINWQSSDNIGLTGHEVQLSLDNGQTYQSLASGLPGSQQTFSFAIPRQQARSKNAIIRVIATDTAGIKGQDDSDNSFLIQKRKKK